MERVNKKYIILGIVAIIGIIVFSFVNPFAWNDGGERTVVQQTDGTQFVEFKSGIFYAGFFAKTTVWPNQISVSYQDSVANMEIVDNGIEIKKITIQFGGDGTKADVSGITQYVLTSDEKEMIEMHNIHRTPQSLVTKRLAPYTKECLQSSAQMMSSEMHYSGGRAQMSQDFNDQLMNGVFLLYTQEKNIVDTVSKEVKKQYITSIQTNKDGSFRRKKSSIKEYGITVADAAITDVDYERKVDQMLAQKIESATKASVSKQEYVTAQQQALTAKMQGEKTLIETQYQEKIVQTKQVVQAETQVKLAEQDKIRNKIAVEAAILAAQKTKTDADAKAYENRLLVAAGLSPLDRARFEKETKIGVAEALSKMQLPSTYISGGNGNKEVGLLESLLGVNLLNQTQTQKK